VANKIVFLLLAGALSGVAGAQSVQVVQSAQPAVAATPAVQASPTAAPVAPAAPKTSAHLDEIISLDAAIERINKQITLKEAVRKYSGNDALPVVTNVIIDGDGPSARVVYSSGMIRTIRVGETVGEGMKVTAINENGVRVGSGKSATFLPFQTMATSGGIASSLPPAPR
jgi:hypothetical protein